MPKKEEHRRNVILAMAAYALARLPFLLVMPLILDESLYAVMFHEQMESPTLIPTFLGYPVSWKPAPFFWAYGAMAAPFQMAGVPFDIACRLPSFIFGLLSVPLMYSLMLRISKSPDVALASSLVAATSGIAIYAQATALSDSASLFFILASIHFYLDEKAGRWRFPLAGLLACAAFFFKLVFTFIPGILAVVWLLSTDRKSLRDPLFALSLAMVPLAMIGHFMLLEQEGLGMEFLIGNFSKHIVSEQGIWGQVGGPFNGIAYLLIFSPFWAVISVIGFIKHWRESAMMSAWYLLALIPLLSSSPLPWYFLPVLPAMAHFCALLLLRHDGRERADAFAFIALAMLAAASLGIFAYPSYEYYRLFQPEKDVGLMMAGRENLLIIGQYAPSIFAYKMLTEEAGGGDAEDFGWVMIQENGSAAMAADFVADYRTEKYALTEGSFSPAFAVPMVFRKGSDLTRFDYIAVARLPDYRPDGSEILYSDNHSGITLYGVGG